MKRIFTFLAAICMVIVAMAQTAGITVSTNGSLKLFSSDKLAEAIAAAQPNDTIYLAAGGYSVSNLPSIDVDYNKYYVINKPLTFIGAGAYLNESDKADGSYFNNGNVAIRLPESEVSKNVSFEGVRFTNTLYVASNLDKLTLRNVYNDSSLHFLSNDTISSNVSDMLIDRCSLSYIYMGEGRVSKAHINNSKIRSSLSGYCSDNVAALSVDHCYIGNLDNDFKGIILNSLLNNSHGSADVTLQNCGYNGYYSGSSLKTNCRHIEYYANTYDDNPESIDATFLCDDGVTPFVTTDGTVFGTSGGQNPYTLYPSYPTPDATASTVEYDAINKKLNVTVKILGVEEPAPAPAE